MQTATPSRPPVAPLKASGPAYNLKYIARAAAEQNLLNDFEREERVREYRRRLVAANWFYEHSDSHDEWRAGRKEFGALIDEQVEIDPDGAIWREVAPAQMSCGLAIPQPRVKGVQS
ncbi:hypothetical protein J2W34_000078 [Variovorax boronicumulans]|uniref:hypothetical protein n=1 Tax=Variovorax boronicumulans TaxID=436515 RepID=UPI0027827813|nr:hypothetical protein [Variovorax boronicumulans]MDQ0068304.1 hypothetical protein [Variovorax boronicumulans]